MAKNDTYTHSWDGSAALANHGLQQIEIYHVPTGYAVGFKAMMTQFQDTYTSEWNSEAVYGRMDPIQTFQRTGRVISVGFDVVAASVAEAAENLERISTLVQFLYPSYDGSGLKNSPFCKIQFMNWAAKSGIWSTAKESGLLGTIGGFTFEPNLDAGTYVGDSKDLYPKILNVSFQFTVIHEHKLGWTIGKSPHHRSVEGDFYPYGVDTANIINKDSDDYETFPSPATKVQRDTVPNTEKEQATAEIMTAPKCAVAGSKECNLAGTDSAEGNAIYAAKIARAEKRRAMIKKVRAKHYAKTGNIGGQIVGSVEQGFRIVD